MKGLTEGDEVGIWWCHEYYLGLMTSDSVFLNISSSMEAIDIPTSKSFYELFLPPVKPAINPTFSVVPDLIDLSVSQ